MTMMGATKQYKTLASSVVAVLAVSGIFHNSIHSNQGAFTTYNSSSPSSSSIAEDEAHRNLPLLPFSQYNLHPEDAFIKFIVCADEETEADCDGVLTFVGPSVTDPAPNEFRYHNSGPANMQGVFWFREQKVGSSVLASFAATRQDFASGVLGSERNAFAVALRPRGDHNWAFAGDGTVDFGSSAWVNEQLDVLYKFELTGGTLEEPRNFRIISEGRLFTNCIRWDIARWFYSLFSQFTMDLVTDTADPIYQRYSNSAIWQRRSTFLLGLYRPTAAAFIYKTVQIIDGNGGKLQPAYDDFVAYVKETYGNRIFYYGLKPERVGDFIDCIPWF